MISESIKKSIPQMIGYLSTMPVIKRLWIFGSCARGEETCESDVDFLVHYDRSHRLTLFTIGGIISNLEKIFGRKIDFVEDGFLIPGLNHRQIKTRYLYMREKIRDRQRLEHILSALG